MENRNFHTSLLGGFRKKDVVSFLAEEKSRQDSALQDLQQQLDEAEGQLQRLMEERDRALEQAQELRQQLQDARDGQEELEERLNDAALREQAMASQSAQSQAEYLQAMEENRLSRIWKKRSSCSSCACSSWYSSPSPWSWPSCSTNPASPLSPS